jgi:hypothetical protein
MVSSPRLSLASPIASRRDKTPSFASTTSRSVVTSKLACGALTSAGATALLVESTSCRVASSRSRSVARLRVIFPRRSSA